LKELKTAIPSRIPFFGAEGSMAKQQSAAHCAVFMGR
jgi:hypothetical protein